MEHWEPLGSRLRVLVSPSHGFTTDTLLLAHFSLPRPGERCAELGCGCGAISLGVCIYIENASLVSQSGRTCYEAKSSLDFGESFCLRLLSAKITGSRSYTDPFMNPGNSNSHPRACTKDVLTHRVSL